MEMGRSSGSYVLKHICPEGQTPPTTIFNDIVNIVFNTKAEGKEIPFQRDNMRIDPQKSEHYFFV